MELLWNMNIYTRTIYVIVAVAITTGIAWSQQSTPIDPDTWQRIVSHVGSQRDAAVLAAAQAETKLARAEARISQLTEEVHKAKEEIEQLRKEKSTETPP
jgi:chromosome segregation ATPase